MVDSKIFADRLFSVYGEGLQQCGAFSCPLAAWGLFDNGVPHGLCVPHLHRFFSLFFGQLLFFPLLCLLSSALIESCGRGNDGDASALALVVVMGMVQFQGVVMGC